MLYFLGALMRRKQVYDEFKSFFVYDKKTTIGFTKEGRETLKKSLKKSIFEINQKMCESHMQDMILSENIYVYDSEEGNLQAV